MITDPTSAGAESPPSVRPFAARVERVAALTPDELVVRAVSGWARLRAVLLPREERLSPETALLCALSRVRDAALRASESRAADLEARAARAERRAVELESAAGERDARIDALAAASRELEVRRAQDQAARSERVALESALAAERSARTRAEAEAAWREREMHHVRAALDGFWFRYLGRDLRRRSLAWSDRERRRGGEEHDA